MQIERGKRVQFIDLGAYLIGLAFGLGILVASGYADWPSDALGRSDLAKFWAGPRALLLGRDPYEARTWLDPTLQLGATLVDWPDHGSTPRYFGWAVLLMFPFALLPLATAFALWTVGGIAAAAAAMYMLLRRTLTGHPIAHTLVAMTLIASQPARLTVLLGQWGFVLTAALVAAVVWTREGRSTRAGLSSIAFLAKPQLFILTAPALAMWAWRRGQRRTIVVASAAGAAIVGLSLVLLPSWPSAWIRDIASPGVTTGPQTTTLASVLYGFFGQPGTWLAFAVIVVCAATCFAFDARGDAWLAAWLSLSLVAAPYVWSYDQTLLVAPLVLGAGVVARRSRRLATGVIITGTFILVVLTTVLAVVAARRNLESYSAVIPLLVFVLLVATMWPARRSAE